MCGGPPPGASPDSRRPGRPGDPRGRPLLTLVALGRSSPGGGPGQGRTAPSRRRRAGGSGARRSLLWGVGKGWQLRAWANARVLWVGACRAGSAAGDLDAPVVPGSGRTHCPQLLSALLPVVEAPGERRARNPELHLHLSSECPADTQEGVSHFPRPTRPFSFLVFKCPKISLPAAGQDRLASMFLEIRVGLCSLCLPFRSV